MEPSEEHYEQAYAESERDQMRPGIYAMCLAQKDGDETKAKALYIQERAKQLADEEEVRRQEALMEEREQARMAAEEEARRVEEEVKKAEAERIEKVRREKEKALEEEARAREIAERKAQEAKEEKERKNAAIKKEMEKLASEQEKWKEEATRLKSKAVAARDKVNLIKRNLKSSNDQVLLLELDKQNLFHAKRITQKKRLALARRCNAAYYCSLVMSIICSVSLLAAFVWMRLSKDSDLAEGMFAITLVGYPVCMIIGQSILDALVGNLLKPHHIAIGMKLREELEVVGFNAFVPYIGHKKIRACYDACVASIPTFTPDERAKLISEISQDIGRTKEGITKLQEALEEAKRDCRIVEEAEQSSIAKATMAVECAVELWAAKLEKRLINEAVLAGSYQVTFEVGDAEEGDVHIPTVEEFKSQYDGNVPLKYYNDKQILVMHEKHIQNLCAASASKPKGSRRRVIIRKTDADLSSGKDKTELPVTGAANEADESDALLMEHDWSQPQQKHEHPTDVSAPKTNQESATLKEPDKPVRESTSPRKTKQTSAKQKENTTKRLVQIGIYFGISFIGAVLMNGLETPGVVMRSDLTQMAGYLAASPILAAICAGILAAMKKPVLQSFANTYRAFVILQIVSAIALKVASK